MDMKRFSIVNRQRCEHPDGFCHPLQHWSLSDWTTAVLGELGEAANIVKKLNRIRDDIPGNKIGESEQELMEKLGDEIADTFCYLDLMAQAAGIDLSDKVIDKFNKVSERICYPIIDIRRAVTYDR